MKRRQDLYLNDILHATKAIREFTADMDFELFLNDYKTQSAVIRQYEIIGEAIKGPDNPLKEKYPDTDWKGIAGMRDILIHNYFGVDLEIVWKTTASELQKLERTVSKIFKEINN